MTQATTTLTRAGCHDTNPTPAMANAAHTTTAPAKCTEAGRDANGCHGDTDGTNCNNFIGQGFQLGNRCMAPWD